MKWGLCKTADNTFTLMENPFLEIEYRDTKGDPLNGNKQLKSSHEKKLNSPHI